MNAISSKAMSFIGAINSWRPQTPFYYGWLVLGTAALGAFAATGVAQVVLGGIQNLIFEDLGWDRSTIAYAVTAGTIVSGLLTPFVGRLADRYGPRGMMPVAVLIVGVCLFGLAGTKAIWHFYVPYIIARAIANPILIGVVPQTVAVNFFSRRRNLALGLTSMARPVSGAINIQLISLIAQAYSWRVAYRFIGLFAVALVVPLFLVMRRRPEDIGLHADGDREPSSGEAQRQRSSTPEVHASTGIGEFDWKVGEAVRTYTFWFLVTAESLVVVASGALGFHVVPFMRDGGLSQALAAGAMSLSTLFGALVSPGWGYLSDRFTPRRLALVAIVITAMVTILFLVADHGQPAFFVVILWGTASGGIHALSSMILAQYFGRASFGSIIGLIGPFQMGALGLGPTIGAVLFSLTGGYRSLFIYSLGAYVVAFVLIYIARSPRLPRRAEAEGPAAGD